jgi:hypothetical protein
MAFVYDSVGGDVGKKSGEIDPTLTSNRVTIHVFKDSGRQKVHDQIERVITIMKLCDDMKDSRHKTRGGL